MLETTPLRQQITRDVFDYQQLVACLSQFSKPRDKICRLLASGEIVRLRKGLYAFGESLRQAPISRELLANLIHGPSYISLDYALNYHGLIPERVEMVTSVTLGRSRTFTTPCGIFSYRRLNQSRYAVGVILEEHNDLSFLIASPEKALADKVWADKRFDGIRLSAYGPYLLDDLRLDPARLAVLDNDCLDAIARAYDSRKLDRLMRCLQTLREQSHA